MAYKYIDGEKLRAMRVERGETQKNVEKITGISTKTIYNYERGWVKRPDEKTIKKLEAYYGVDASCFVCVVTDDERGNSK